MQGSITRVFLAFWCGGMLASADAIAVDCRDAREREIHYPLASAKVEVELAGPLVVTRWTLAFRNPGHRVGEGRLEVELPPGLTVSGYALEVEGKMREGVIAPRSLARASYQEIVDRMVDPGILELTPAGFVTRLYPIPVGGTKAFRVEMTGVRPEGMCPWPLARGGETKVEWRLLCRDPRPPQVGGNPGEWRSEGDAWVMSGESSAGELARMRIEAARAAPEWAVSLDSGVAWAFGRVPVSVGDIARQAPAKLTLWWDGSLAGCGRSWEKVSGCLQSLLEWMGHGEVILRVFRERALPAERFVVTGGGCEALLVRLRDEPSEGMARFDVVTGDTGDGMILVVSEGRTPLPACRPRIGAGLTFDLLDPSGQGGGMLGWSAARVGGEVLAPSERDWSHRHPVPGRWRDSEVWSCRRQGDHWIVAGRVPGKMLDELSGEMVRCPHARHAWAVEKRSQMDALQVGWTARTEFARLERVLCPDGAFLVLEALDDYVRYGIQPPEPEWAEPWAKGREQLRMRSDAGNDGRLARWTDHWRKQQEMRERAQPDYAARLTAAIDGTRAKWQRLEVNRTKKTPVDGMARLEELRAAAEQVRAGVDDGKERLRRLAEIGAKWERLVDEVGERLGTMPVLVSGHVRHCGLVELVHGSTIMEAIEAAGGATEFGSLKRVRLLRDGKMRMLDLRADEFKAVRIEPNDTIEVPQKMVFGDGGGTDGGAPVATPKGLVASLETSSVVPVGAAMEPIARLLGQGGDWQAAFRAAGNEYGWSSAFLRQVAALLEERGRKDEARRVAGSLAQAAPDDPAALRVAAGLLGRVGDRDAARLIFDRLRTEQPDEPAVLLAIARFHRDGGQWLEAVRAYAAITERPWDTGQVGVWMTAMTELNAVLHRQGARLATGIVDSSRTRPLAADLRLVVEHDREPRSSPFEVTCTDSFGGRANHGNLVATDPWQDSGASPLVDVLTHEAVPGTYVFRVSRPGSIVGQVTETLIEAELFLNFGRANESSRRLFLRLDESRYAELARVIWQVED